MQCPNCQRELRAGIKFCPVCGKAVASKPDGYESPVATRLSVKATGAALSVDAFSQEAGVRTGISTDGPPSNSQPPEAQDTGQATAHPSQAAASWRPKKDRVKAWAVARTLNHYEILDADESTDDATIQQKIKALAVALNNYADELDGASQEIGRVGKELIYQLRDAFADRPKYNEIYKRELRAQSSQKIRTLAREKVEKDKVLQWKEWLALQDAATDEGLTTEELESIIQDLKAEGALTGITVASKEVRTLLELKDTCAGKGKNLVEVMWDGELERWLDQACEKPNLAAEVRQIKQEYEDRKELGAHVFLWKMKEDRLVLEEESGMVEITDLQQWLGWASAHGKHSPSFAGLDDGRLEGWMRTALKREDLAKLAADATGKGRSGLLKLIDDVKSMSGRLRSSFKFKNGEAYSVADLINLCDQYPEEARVYFEEELIFRWLIENLGEADLAMHARNAKRSYPEEEAKGLEMLVRELCNNIQKNPYPHLTCHPAHLNLSQIPVGAQTTINVSLSNHNRGYAWGSIAIEPPLPGLTVSPEFDGVHSVINLHLDALLVTPGFYSGVLVVRAVGVPNAFQVPIEYEVVPLSVSITPHIVDLGKIPLGKSRNLTLSVNCAPGEGRITGRASVTPSLQGLKVQEDLSGNACNLLMSVDTSSLEAGRRYKTSLWLDTNAGKFQVPVEFNTQMRWDIVASWTAGIALATATVMWVCRFLLSNAGLNQWVESYINSLRPEMLVPCGIFSVAVIGAIALIVRTKYIKKKS